MDEVTNTGTEQAPATPVETPVPAAPEQAADQSAAPSEGAAPEPEGFKPVPTEVPYPRFREVQVGYTEARRQAQALQSERDEYRGRLAALEEQRQAERQEIEDARVFGQILRERPDLYEQLKAIADGEQSSGRPTAPTGSALGPEERAMLRETAEYVRLARQREQERAERESAATRESQRQEARGTLRGDVKNLMQRAGYPEAIVEDLSEDALEWILWKANELPGRGAREDVPYLFTQWHERQQKLLQARNAAYVQAKTVDRNLPPAMPGGTMTQAVPKPGTFRDGSVEEQAARYLRERGWGASG